MLASCTAAFFHFSQHETIWFTLVYRHTRSALWDITRPNQCERVGYASVQICLRQDRNVDLPVSKFVATDQTNREIGTLSTRNRDWLLHNMFAYFHLNSAANYSLSISVWIPEFKNFLCVLKTFASECSCNSYKIIGLWINLTKILHLQFIW